MTSFEDDTNPFGDNSPEQFTQHVDLPQEPEVAPPTPAKTAGPPLRAYPGLKTKDGFCCVRDEYLHSDNAEIQVTAWCHQEALLTSTQIVDALKMTDHTGKVYIAYVIHTGVRPCPVCCQETNSDRLMIELGGTAAIFRV